MMPQQPVFRCLKQCVTLGTTSGFVLVCNCGETWVSLKEQFTRNTVTDCASSCLLTVRRSSERHFFSRTLLKSQSKDKNVSI